MAMTRGAFAHAVVMARATGRLHKGALPRQAEPLAQQRRYAKRIKRRVLEDAMRLVREILVPELERLAEQASKVGASKPTTDAAHCHNCQCHYGGTAAARYALDTGHCLNCCCTWSIDAAKTDDLGEIMDQIADAYAEKWSRREFVKVVRPVAVEVDMFSTTQLNKQLSAALGEALSVDVVGNEPWVAQAITDFTRENVALIKTIPDQFFSELEKTLSREIADGARWEDLAAAVEDRYSVSESRAELIARDQVSKFNGDLARTRQQELGVDRFIWRTMGDERVREEHALYNGNTYSWSDAPEGGPGEPIQCRCYAEPDVLSALGDEG